MFKDGHVGVSGGNFDFQYNENHLLGGYGFSVRQLDDGRVIVVFVSPGSPADQAGIQVGAELITYGGEPVQTALENVTPFQPQSTDFGRRYEQTVFLTRGGIGEKYLSPSKTPIVRRRRLRWYPSMRWTAYSQCIWAAHMMNIVLPSEYEVLPSGVGYIKVNSNYDDLSLLIRVFERALETFEAVGVPGIIIDMRQNLGGAPMGLAGFLYNKEIPLGQLEYYSDKTGQFEPDGPRNKVLPNEKTYSFNRMVLLVNQFCFSACEIDGTDSARCPAWS